MPDLLVPALAAYALLAAAGGLKLRRPAATAQALHTQGLPSSTAVVRLLGTVEVVAGLGALAGLAPAAVVAGLLYVGATVFVAAVLVRRRPLSSCGCFGQPDLPPSVVHPFVTGLLAVAALGARAGLPATDGAGAAVAVVAAAALTASLAYLVLTGLPRLAAAAAPVRRTS